MHLVSTQYTLYIYIKYMYIGVTYYTIMFIERCCRNSHPVMDTVIRCPQYVQTNNIMLYSNGQKEMLL